MSTFLFLGHAPRFYPDFGNLVALPGDVCEFEAEPSDGLWAEAAGLPVTDTSGRSWPVQPEAAPAEVPAETSTAGVEPPVQPAPVLQDTPAVQPSLFQPLGS